MWQLETYIIYSRATKNSWILEGWNKITSYIVDANTKVGI